MRQALTALIAIACFAVCASGNATAQQPGTASVGFTNKSDVNVNVVGYTVVNGSKRFGPALPLKKTGGKAFETNVPPGVRFYAILNANTGQLIGNGQFQIQRGGDVSFDVVPSANPKILMIVPSQ